MDKKRYLTPFILKDLKEKMVFVGGARQVGKTTLAQNLVASHFDNPVYLNWDNRNHRKKIMEGTIPGPTDLIIFDEIHKYKKWKSLVKGEYDIYKDKIKIIVTGSARLNVYRKGGDSLLGRYHYYTLHPFSLAEVLNLDKKISVFKELKFSNVSSYYNFELLEHFGGFPEIFTKQNERMLRRWHNEKIERLFREDIRDLGTIRDIGSMQLLSDILPDKVGSLLSINSIREDLEVSHRAVSNWLDILEQLYYQFRVYPFHEKKIRSIRKEPKLYLFDWSEIENEPARFENLIGSHLLKFVHFLYEHEGYKANLYFLRNVDKKEVDFLVTIDSKPWFCVEVKLQETTPEPSLFYFRERLDIPFCYQVVKKKDVDLLNKGIRIISANKFLSGLI